jgi:serine/threonine protein kinase
MSHNNNSRTDEIPGKIFFKYYKAEKKLGEGSFGKIYTAINIKTKELYAIKLERKDFGQGLLETEARIFSHLKGFGIPEMKTYGYNQHYNILIMELLGYSLEEFFQKMKKKFSIKTTCMLGLQMIDRIEWVHNKNLIHRDIKPDNFVMGRGDKNHIVYILDFGLSKKYFSSKNSKHIKFTQNKKLTGTARYASINAIKGCEQSRRDDLESIGYVLMYFLRGSLPWQGLKNKNGEDRYTKIYEKKKNTTPEELCNNFPDEFKEFVNYTRHLQFESKPDYDYLRGLLKNVMNKLNYEYDYFYDWFEEKPIIKPEYLLDNNKYDSNEKKEDDKKEFFNFNINMIEQNKKNKNGNEINTIERLNTNKAILNADIPNLKEKNLNNIYNNNEIPDNDKKNCIIF